MRFATSAAVDVVEQINAKTVIQPTTVSALRLRPSFRGQGIWKYLASIRRSGSALVQKSQTSGTEPRPLDP